MSGSEIGRSCGRSTFRGSGERDGDGERSRIHRKWSPSASRTAGLAAQTMSFGACLGARSVLGNTAPKNELRTGKRRSRGTRSQQNVKILRHFREFVKKN